MKRLRIHDAVRPATYRHYYARYRELQWLALVMEGFFHQVGRLSDSRIIQQEATFPGINPVVNQKS